MQGFTQWCCPSAWLSVCLSVHLSHETRTQKHGFLKTPSNLEPLFQCLYWRPIGSPTWAIQRTHSWIPTLNNRNSIPWCTANLTPWPTEKPRTLPHSKPREKLHPREIYASGGGLLINAPHLFSKYISAFHCCVAASRHTCSRASRRIPFLLFNSEQLFLRLLTVSVFFWHLTYLLHVDDNVTHDCYNGRFDIWHTCSMSMIM